MECLHLPLGHTCMESFKLLSRVMRKPAFCICKNKGADQLRGNRLYFRNMDSTLIRNFRSLIILLGCAVQFVSDLVVNPKDKFSHVAAHILQNQAHVSRSLVLWFTAQNYQINDTAKLFFFTFSLISNTNVSFSTEHSSNQKHS